MRASVSRALAVLQAVVLSAAIVSGTCATQHAPSDRVLVVNVDGAISVAAARQVSRVIVKAKKQNANAIVVRLDTPGGLVSATVTDPLRIDQT